ncbi:MAG: hypothetical protein ACW990_07070, partial [Promethearchaeota archaeon]
LTFYFILYILPLFNYSVYAAIVSTLNIGSYLAFAFSIYQLRNWIFYPQYYPKKKISRNFLINGLFIIVTCILFLSDGINRSIPESRLFYIIYYLSLILPLLLHGIFFVIYGCYLLVKTNGVGTEPTHISLAFGRKMWKIKRRTFSKLIVVEALSFIIISTSLIGNTAILKHFSYNVNYEINTGDPKVIIEKAETLNYPSLLKYRDAYGILHDITNTTFDDHLITNYIDRDYIEFLKEEMSKDSKKFHWWFGYRRSFNYEFSANMVSKINLTHENGTLMRVQYENLEDIFTVRQNYSIFDPSGYYYINFTLVTYSVNETSILLNDSVLSHMILEYDYLFGSLGGLFYVVNQYLVLDENSQVICIYVPKFPIMVA